VRLSWDGQKQASADGREHGKKNEAEALSASEVNHEDP
jgi:hypothetical protein